MGVDARQFRRASERGELVRIHRGVFVDAATWRALEPSEQYRHRVIGAARASRTAPTLSHASAAALWGVPLLTIPRLVDVLSTPSVGTRTENGFRRHSTTCGDLEVVCRDGVSVTSFPRTLAEYCAGMPFRASVVALDWAIRPSSARDPKPFATKEDIRLAADLLHINRNRHKLDRALAFADGLSGSPGESLSRALMLELGFPIPELQVDFSDHRGFIGTVDFWWPDQHLIGEFDGVAKYIRPEYTGGRSAAEVVVDEKNRENRLRATGPRVTRWDWSIAKSPALLLEHLTSVGLSSSRRRQRG
jgi:hypothetical protein